MAVSTAPRPVGRSGVPDKADLSILSSKVTVPGLPGWAVPRPRINALLAAGAGGPLTAVIGPPGSGKTLAMASWAAAERDQRPVAWVTVDRFDNRPRVFWRHVLAALRQAGVFVPRLSWPAALADTMGQGFLIRLIGVLAAQDPPVILVLDDVHLLTAPVVLDGLSYLLRHSRPGLHLIVASRMDPLLPLHRFRLTRELTEIRGADLAFGIGESVLLMAQHNIALSAESLARLTGRTEGWAAGLRLAALSMAGHPDPDQFVKEFVTEDSPVAGYLVDEVLNAQTQPVRDLLLRTSILDGFDAELASELSAGHAGNDLPELARANAFVQPLGGGWYRYHTLFGDVLRLKIRHEAPNLVADLYRQAARWHQRQGGLTEAVRYAAKAGDWPLAAKIAVAELAVGQLIEPRGDHPLGEEFAQMPPAIAWDGPEPFLVAAALAEATSRSGDTWLAAADDALATLPADEAAAARLASAQIRLAQARRTGDLAAASAAVDEAQVLLEAIPAAVQARSPWPRAQAEADRGVVHFWSGWFGEAAATFEAAAAAAPMPECAYERAACLSYLALLEALRGRLNHAVSLATEAAGGAMGEGDRPSGQTGPAGHVALAAAHLERAEMRQAHAQLRLAEAGLHRHADKLTGTVATLVAARKALAEGHPDRALELVRQARQPRCVPSWLRHRLALLESRACAVAGDGMSALAAAEEADPDSLEATVAVAHAWLAADEPQAARAALAAHSERAGTEPVADFVRLEAWLTAARLSYSGGARADGRRSLQRALRLGEPERLRLPFVMAGGWLRRVLRSDPELALVYRDLLEPGLAGPGRDHVARAGQGEPAPVLFEPLSTRELEVLRCASEMLDTSQIAATMFISVNTVKSHLKSIYRKLAVTHRGEAVRRARQLGVL